MDAVFESCRKYEGGLEMSDSAGQVSYGDMAFLASVKKIDLARFMLRPRTLQECMAQFPSPPYADYFDYYKAIAVSPSKAMLYMRFGQTYDLVCELEKYKTAKLTRDEDGKISAALSTFSMPFAPYVMLSCVALGAAVNRFIDHVNEAFPENKIESLATFSHKFPSGRFPEVPDPLTAATALGYLQEYQRAELEVIDYVHECEKYQVLAAAKMDEITRAINTGK
jgi:hypothetical protein